jgi:hypothetical protein
MAAPPVIVDNMDGIAPPDVGAAAEVVPAAGAAGMAGMGDVAHKSVSGTAIMTS